MILGITSKRPKHLDYCSKCRKRTPTIADGINKLCKACGHIEKDMQVKVPLKKPLIDF